jgi:hypothetical protein
MTPFWQMVNTKVELAGPLNTSLEAAFGQAALVLLEKGDIASQEKLMDLYGKAKGLMKELDGLLKPSARS